MELIETVIIYKLPHLSRKEVQAMLLVDDIRKTRVFQEGIEEGKLRGVAKLAALAALNMSPEQIAEALELDIELVRKEMTGCNGAPPASA